MNAIQCHECERWFWAPMNGIKKCEPCLAFLKMLGMT